MAEKAITRRLKIYINGEEVDNTISNLRKNLAKFRAQANRATEGSEDWKRYNTEVAKLDDELKKAYLAQREFREEVKLTETGIDDSNSALQLFTGNLSQVKNGIADVDFLEASNGLDGLKKGFITARTAALAFIATPVGIILTALAGISAVVKFWRDYNEEIKESVILTEQITGLQGKQADAARLQAEAMSQTFGTDFQENLETADALVKNFKISYDEAFAVIEDGLVKGQTVNKEYFDSLKEYSVFFEQAGFSAQEFKDIISTGYDLKIYSDKLPDAIKEGMLAITEQTDATKESLTNAFGAAFTSDILSRVETGKVTVKDALTEIAVKSKEVGINAQQAQQLTADLFKGAGEDAGGAVKILEAIATSAENATRALTPLEQSTKELADTNLKLEKAQDRALKSDNYIAFTREIEVFWTKIKTAFFNGIAFITDKFTEVNDFVISTVMSIVATAEYMPKVIKKGLKEVAQNVLDTIKTFGGLGDVLTKLLSFDLSGAAASAKDFKNNFKEAFSEVKNSASDTIDQIVELQQKAQENALKSIQSKREANVASVKASEPLVASTNDNPNKETITDKEAEKKLEQIKKNEEQITEFIKGEIFKREQAKRTALEQELAEIDAKYAAQIEKAAENDALVKELEELKRQERQEAELAHQREFEEKKRELQEELELEKAESDEEKEILRAELEAEKRARELEELALNEEEKQALLASIEENKQLQIEGIKKKYREQEIKEEQRLFAEKRRLQENNLNAAIAFAGQETKIGQLLLAAKQVIAAKESLLQLGLLKNKIIVDKARASSSIAAGTAETAKVGFPQNIPLLIGFAAQVFGIISAIKGAASATAAIKPPSFFAGGETHTGPNSGGVDGKGGLLSILHPKEYVVPEFVRQDPEVPEIINYLEEKRLRKLGSFKDGGDVTPTTPLPQAKNPNDALLLEVLVDLHAQISRGIKAFVSIGYDEVLELKDLENKINNTKKAAEN